MTLSEPKPLRFRHVEDRDEEPDWVAMVKSGSGGPSPLQLTQVLVDGIDNGVLSEVEVAAEPSAGPLSWEEAVAPLFGAEEQRERHTLPPPPEQEWGSERPSLLPEGFGGGAAVTGLAEQEIARYGEAVADLATMRHELLAQVEGQLLDLSLRIAEAIVEAEVVERPELHRSLVRTALQCVEGERKVDLHVSSEAYGVLRELFGGATFEQEGIEVTLVEKPTLHGLGCIVEAGNVHIDGRVSQRLLAVRRAFDELQLQEAERSREEVG